MVETSAAAVVVVVVVVVVAAGWPDRKLVAAAEEAEVILRLDLVSVPVTALSAPLADTADSRSKVVEVEALEQLTVDRSTSSEAARQARCLEDLGY